VLSAEEFARLCEAAEDWLKPMLVVAYHTGMRKGEIRSLRWDQLDLKTGTIRLRSSDTKTDEGARDPYEPDIDKHAQNCYKIRALSMGVRQSGPNGRAAGKPRYG
jgi:integrase